MVGRLDLALSDIRATLQAKISANRSLALGGVQPRAAIDQG